MMLADREKFAQPDRNPVESIHAWAHWSSRPGYTAELKGMSAPLNGKGEWREAAMAGQRPALRIATIPLWIGQSSKRPFCHRNSQGRSRSHATTQR